MTEASLSLAKFHNNRNTDTLSLTDPNAFRVVRSEFPHTHKATAKERSHRSLFFSSSFLPRSNSKMPKGKHEGPSTKERLEVRLE